MRKASINDLLLQNGRQVDNSEGCRDCHFQGQLLNPVDVAYNNQIIRSKTAILLKQAVLLIVRFVKKTYVVYANG
jgi:hypothetical protein